jgi:hypothetical protein
MSGSKRALLAYKTPVAILVYMQTVLSDVDYVDLQACVFEHDAVLNRTQVDAKKHCSDAFLYTKSCTAIFAELHATLLQHCDFMHAMHKCLDVSLLVADIMAGHDLDLDLGGNPGDADKGRVDSDKRCVNEKTASLRRGVAVISKRCQERLRDDRDTIVNTNSQLRFSLRYKTLARILHLARGVEESVSCAVVATQHEAEMGDHPRFSKGRTADSLIEAVMRGSNAYETLKNKCMLGAIIKYTQRSQERLRSARAQTIMCGVAADTVARIECIENELVKKAAAMLQTTHSLDEKKQRIECATRQTMEENVLLQNELDSVQLKIQQMHG